MAKGPATGFSGDIHNFAEQNTQQARDAANYGIDLMRQLTQQGLEQGRVVFEGFLAAARGSADTLDQHASEVRERSLTMAAETVNNSFDFAHQILHARDPQQVIQLQSEFLSRQAQTLASQAKELGQTIARGANEFGRNTSGQMQATADNIKRQAES